MIIEYIAIATILITLYVVEIFVAVKIDEFPNLFLVTNIIICAIATIQIINWIR